MCDQNIDILRKIGPDLLPFYVGIGEAHLVVSVHVRRAKYANAFHFHLLMHEVGADFLESGYFFWRIHLFLWLGLEMFTDCFVDI
jgi:hypothetical protein